MKGKRKLCTSIYIEEWKSKFFKDGIKKGDFYSQERETKRRRILVQSADYIFHHAIGKFLVVEFWKKPTAVFEDPGWEDSVPVGKATAGIYVNRILPEEIIRVYPVIGRIHKTKGCQVFAANGTQIS